MNLSHQKPFIFFTLKETFRSASQTWATILTLVVMTAFPGTLLLLTSAIETTAERLLERAPSIVVRQVSTYGWKPMPVSAVQLLEEIPGALSVEPRVWGLCSSDFGAVTAMTNLSQTSPDSIPKPKAGEAIMGPGLPIPESQTIILHAEKTIPLSISRSLDNTFSTFLSACVLIHEDDARELFTLPIGTCSDISMTFFHDTEAVAAIPEIIAKLPFPVQVSTKQDTLKLYSGNLAKWGGLSMMLLIPSLLAMFFFLWTQRKMMKMEKRNIGILKMLGWTTIEITWSQILRSLLIGIPSCLIGCSLAYFMVYGPNMTWPARFFLGWSDTYPSFNLVPIWRILFELGGFIIVPYIASQLFPLFRSATTDPAKLLEGGGQ